jgi:hypothetical protein
MRSGEEEDGRGRVVLRERYLAVNRKRGRIKVDSLEDRSRSNGEGNERLKVNDRMDGVERQMNNQERGRKRERV